MNTTIRRGLKIPRFWTHPIPPPQPPLPPTTLSHPTALTPHPAATIFAKKMRNSPKTPKTPKNKKTNLRKKIENKRNLPDIRKFWKTLGNNGDNDISRQEEDTINVKEDKTNLRKKDDPGK